MGNLVVPLVSAFPEERSGAARGTEPANNLSPRLVDYGCNATISTQSQQWCKTLLTTAASAASTEVGVRRRSLTRYARDELWSSEDNSRGYLLSAMILIKWSAALIELDRRSRQVARRQILFETAGWMP